MTGLKYGNGLYASFGFSSDRLQLNCLDYSTTNRGTSCTHDGTTKFGLRYSYPGSASNNGLISSIIDSVDNGRSASYTYDSLYRLLTAKTVGSTNYPAWGLSETYDKYGNRSAQTAIAGTCVSIACPQPSVTISPTTNRLIGPPYSYDSSGNMTDDGINTLVYDAEDHVVSVSNGSGSGTYTYDGNGQRVEKVGGGNTIVTLFSGSQVLDEYYNGVAPSSPTNEYIYAGGLRVAIIQSGSTYYWHNDHLSPRVRTDSSGNIADQRGTFPFGETWYTPGSTAPWMFTTYYRDVEAEGNDYAQARTYVSGLGRFASPDPVSGSTSDPQSLNRYSYVRNMPALMTDPFGLTPFCATVRNNGTGADTEPSGGGPSADTNDVEADPPQQGCGLIDCNYTVEGCPVDDGFGGGGGGGGGGGIWGTQGGFGDFGFGPWDFGPFGDGGFGDSGILGWLGGGGGFGPMGPMLGPIGPSDPCAMDADGSLAALGVCGSGQSCLVGGMPGFCTNWQVVGGGVVRPPVPIPVLLGPLSRPSLAQIRFQQFGTVLQA